MGLGRRSWCKCVLSQTVTSKFAIPGKSNLDALEKAVDFFRGPRSGLQTENSQRQGVFWKCLGIDISYHEFPLYVRVSEMALDCLGV
jgi:hypothetical protein